MNSELPASWYEVPLSSIARKLTDGSHNPPSKQLDGVPMLSARNVMNSHIEFDEFRHISESDFAIEDARTRVSPNDVLLTIVGTIGRSCVVEPRHGKFALQRSVAVIGLDALDPKFLMYQLQSSAAQRYFQANARGTAQKGIYLKVLGALPIRVAPVDEQHRIVEAIETQLTRLDAAVAALKRAQANLKRYRASVLKAAVEGRLGAEIADCNNRWPSVRLRELGQIQGGIQKQPKRAPADNAFPYLRVANVGRGKLNLVEIHSMQLFNGELEKLRLESGDLLVVEGNGSPTEIGRMAIWGGEIADCVHQNHIIRVRLGDRVLPEFVAAYWNSVDGAKAVSRVASSTSGLFTLSVRKVGDIEVPVPSLAVQEQVLLELDKATSTFDDHQRAIQSSLLRAVRLRQSILRQAFAGALHMDVA